MPQYVIEREIPGAGSMTKEQLDAAARDTLAVLQDLGPEIQWLHSFVTDDKIFCIYFAPDETLLREHARRLGLPVDRVSTVRGMLSAEGVKPVRPFAGAAS